VQKASRWRQTASEPSVPTCGGAAFVGRWFSPLRRRPDYPSRSHSSPFSGLYAAWLRCIGRASVGYSTRCRRSHHRDKANFVAESFGNESIRAIQGGDRPPKRPAPIPSPATDGTVLRPRPVGCSAAAFGSNHNRAHSSRISTAALQDPPDLLQRRARRGGDSPSSRQRIVRGRRRIAVLL